MFLTLLSQIFLFIFLYNKVSTLIYKIIKNICEINFGISSQIIIVKKVLKNKRQI